jgi:hypothetical protein
MWVHGRHWTRHRAARSKLGNELASRSSLRKRERRTDSARRTALDGQRSTDSSDRWRSRSRHSLTSVASSSARWLVRWRRLPREKADRREHRLALRAISSGRCSALAARSHERAAERALAQHRTPRSGHVQVEASRIGSKRASGCKVGARVEAPLTPMFAALRMRRRGLLVERAERSLDSCT